jgi:LacI family transcriptional regulator
MSRRTTIEDVARHAGVGKVTVSYVLNGRSKEARISDETCKRIFQAADELHYRPNAVARMLATRRTDTLAVVLQSGTYFTAWSSFTSEVMRGIAEATVKEGCDLMLHTKQVRDAMDEADALSDGRVDGALVLRDEDDPTLMRLVEIGFNCVQFFLHSDDLDVPWVDCDNVKGGAMATDHLLALGHRKIAMVCGAARSVSSNDRIVGFRQAMSCYGLPVREHWVVSHADPSNPPDQALEMFRADDRPTALFVWSDDVAVPIMMGLRDLGLSVPGDVSIVGFDSSVRAETALPALTSVRQPVREMAAQATHMLVSIIRNREIQNRQILIDPSLDVRASTAPIAHPHQ